MSSTPIRYNFDADVLNALRGGVEHEYQGEPRLVRPAPSLIPVSFVTLIDEDQRRVRWDYEYAEVLDEHPIVRSSEHFTAGFGRYTGRLLWIELDYSTAAESPLRGTLRLIQEYRQFLDHLIEDTEILGERLNYQIVRDQTAPTDREPEWVLALAG